MELILKLILVHVIVDFILQTDESVKHKREHKIKSSKLYVHSLLHGIGSLFVVQSYTFMPYALVILVSHFLIDLVKLYAEKETNKRLLFFIDQLLHFIIITIVGCLYIKYDFNGMNITEIINKHILLVTCLILLTKPAAIFIRVFISKWSLKKDVKTDDGAKTSEPPEREVQERDTAAMEAATTKEETLAEAGMWIGILERLLIFGFIWVGKWEAIGFLLAAKSVFRFGDLKDTNDQNKTEYILIGTLSSFMVAIIIGFAFIQLSPKEKKKVEKTTTINNIDSIFKAKSRNISDCKKSIKIDKSFVIGKFKDSSDSILSLRRG
jgi:hypothetical protein